MSSICVRCVRQIAAGVVTCLCRFSKASSAKCDRCRDQKSKCLPLPEEVHDDALELLAIQEDHLAGGPSSEDEVRASAGDIVAGIDHLARAARSAVGDASSPLRRTPARPAAGSSTTDDLLCQLLAAQNQTNALLREMLRHLSVEEIVEEEDEDEDMEDEVSTASSVDWLF